MKSNPWYRIASIFIIAFILLPGIQSAKAQVSYFDLPFKRNRVTIPFENFDNIVIVKTLINDSIPVKLIVDSGVEGILITDMKVAGMFTDRCIRNFRLSAPGTIELLEACITSPVLIKISGLVPLVTNMILLDEDYFSLESYIGTNVHGLIGMEKFRNLVVTTDYDHNTMTFIRPSAYKLPHKAEVIPIIIDRGKPHMNARVEFDDGSIKDLWLMIDSGANHPLLLENTSLDGYSPAKSLEATIGKGLAGNMKGEFARIGWLMLGNYRLDNVITSFTDSYIPGSSALRLNRNGTIGSGTLSRFKMTFDYSRERMILQKGLKFKKPFEYNMSGITFRSIGVGFNVFEATDIIPGSPADLAGIQPGDILLSINNDFTIGMTLGEINSKLSAGDGLLIHMKISRLGNQLDFKFRLRKLI